MKNQTEPNWVIEYGDENGLGLFLVPDPQSETFGAAKVVEANGISYDSCLVRGYFTIAFKWIPQTILGQAENEPDHKCKGRCVETCRDPLCICNRVNGRCQKRA